MPSKKNKKQEKEEFLDFQYIFKRNAYLLIVEMLKMQKQTTEDTSALVDEILHSLFFLGRIIDPPFRPRELLGDDDEILAELKETYPEPFNLYSSRLPRRSPFSCVLDMVVKLKGQEREDEIRQTLQNIIVELAKGASKRVLFSSTICVSHANNSARHYGVSMSTSGRPAGQILVAASCLSFWHEYVADAVMSYYPHKKRKDYFELTIQLPTEVECKAFNIRNNVAINPCLSCKDMFGLKTTAETKWPYGHCAEAESLSNLLEEEQVKVGVERIGNWSEENRETAKTFLRNDLKDKLEELKVDFKWDNDFYTAQSARPENEEGDV